MIKTTKSGSFLTDNGEKVTNQIQKIIPNECKIKKCSVVTGKNNHAIILKGYGCSIKSGVEQRDYAVLYGSSGCTTILFKDNRFIFPGESKDCFRKDEKTNKYILENLSPEEGDVIIISSSDDPFVAEISAKNSALWTLATN